MSERDESQANPDIHSITADQIEAAVNNPQILAAVGQSLQDWVLELPVERGLGLISREQPTGPETTISITVTETPRLYPSSFIEISESYRSPLTNQRHGGISCLIHIDQYGQGKSRSYHKKRSYQPLTPEILYSLIEHFEIPLEIFASK